MNLIIKGIDDEVIREGIGISIPQQIAYTSVDDIIVNDIKYYIIRKIFDHKNDVLNIIVDKVI